jgi:hypothetical protein
MAERFTIAVIVKGREIERLARRHLLPALPGFVVRRSLVYRRPLAYFLCGLSFDTSSFTGSRIFVEAFVQPLYTPYDDLIYTFGFRLGDEFWDVDGQNPDRTFIRIADDVRREALPFFGQITDLDRFRELVPAWAADDSKVMNYNSLSDPVVTDVLGYTEVLRGNRDDGLQLLQQAIASERESGEYANEDLIENPQQVLDAVRDLGLEAGQALLEEWRVQTITSLGLEE